MGMVYKFVENLPWAAPNTDGTIIGGEAKHSPSGESRVSVSSQLQMRKPYPHIPADTCGINTWDENHQARLRPLNFSDRISGRHLLGAPVRSGRGRAQRKRQ